LSPLTFLRSPFSAQPPHDRRGFAVDAARRAGYSTPHPEGPICYNMLRFPLPAEVWRVRFSAQVTIRQSITTISLLTLVGRKFRLNSILKNELRRYDPRSRFPPKNAFSTPFQAVLPPSGPRIIAESGRAEGATDFLPPGKPGWPTTSTWLLFSRHSPLASRLSSGVRSCAGPSPLATA